MLILSARADDQDRIRGLELQADDYLTKPFNLRELLLRVDALLRRRPAPAAGSDTLEFGGNRVDFRAMTATPPRASSDADCDGDQAAEAARWPRGDGRHPPRGRRDALRERRADDGPNAGQRRAAAAQVI